jgi:hypothetical protein
MKAGPCRGLFALSVSSSLCSRSAKPVPTENPIQLFHQCSIVTLRSKLAIISIRQGQAVVTSMIES